MDKAHHFIWTSWLVFVLSYTGNIQFAFFFAMIGACVKEAYDSYQLDNKWDWWDILSGLGGALTALGFLALR